MERTPEFGGEFGGIKGILGAMGSGRAPLPEMSEFPNAPKISHPEQFDFDKYQANQTEMDKAYGVDPEFWNKQTASMDEQIAAREKDYTRDKWGALAEAGARMMRTPGGLGQAIGAGAEIGLGALKEATADFRRDKQTLQQLKTRLGAAQQAEAQGKSAEAQKIRTQMEEQYRSSLNREAEIQFNRDAKIFELQENRKLTEAEMQDRWSRAEYNAKLKFMISASESNAAAATAKFNTAKELLGLYKNGIISPPEFIELQEMAVQQANEQMPEGDESLQDLDPKAVAEARNKRAKENLAKLLDQYNTVNKAQTQSAATRSGLGFSATRIPESTGGL
jgi:hypothetical protein